MAGLAGRHSQTNTILMIGGSRNHSQAQRQGVSEGGALGGPLPSVSLSRNLISGLLAAHSYLHWIRFTLCRCPGTTPQPSPPGSPGRGLRVDTPSSGGWGGGRSGAPGCCFPTARRDMMPPCPFGYRLSLMTKNVGQDYITSPCVFLNCQLSLSAKK